MGARLTRKKLEDLRFRRNEEAIFKAFFGEGGGNCSVTQIVKRAGIDRATFYRHHRTACEIIEDYEEYISEEYDGLIKELRGRKEMKLRRMYYEMLVFIVRNQKIFEVLIKKKDLKVIDEMVAKLELEATIFVRVSDEVERIFMVYKGEIVGLIVNWGLRGFKIGEIRKLLDNMMYLTETVQRRLFQLEN